MGNSQSREFKAARKQTEFSLAGRNLDELPVHIGLLTSCVSLDVSNNKLSSLPIEFGTGPAGTRKNCGAT